MNAEHLADYGDPEIDTRIAQYEMAYRMQSSVPNSSIFPTNRKRPWIATAPMLWSKEPLPTTAWSLAACWNGGVRFVQLMHAGWDQHNNLFTQLEGQCIDTDAPSAALVKDLKERGLLEDIWCVGWRIWSNTLWSGRPNQPKGRDHFGKAYSWWLAGGGIKPGTTYGQTDDFAWNIQENPVHVHDMQATILHSMWHRSYPSDLPLPRPPISPHRRSRQPGPRHPGVALFVVPASGGPSFVVPPLGGQGRRS